METVWRKEREKLESEVSIASRRHQDADTEVKSKI
jgi:hypothetical protein